MKKPLDEATLTVSIRVSAVMALCTAAYVLVLGLSGGAWPTMVVFSEGSALAVFMTVLSVSLRRKARRGEPLVWGLALRRVFLVYCVLVGVSMFVIAPVAVVDLTAARTGTGALVLAVILAVALTLGGVVMIAVGIWTLRRKTIVDAAAERGEEHLSESQ